MTDTDKMKSDAIKSGMKQAIAERKKSDPFAGVKIGCLEINQRIISALKNERGVHIESLLSVLGSLAGYACQVAVREEMVVQQRTPENQAFVIVESKDGSRYFFGDNLNKPLAESQYSIWALTAGAVNYLGKKPPDISEIFKHVSNSLGTYQFGIPRIADNHTPIALPIAYLNDVWPHILPIAMGYCETPSELPILFGLAIQQAIFMGKDTIDPVLAATIVMECAIPMSKVDLKAA